MSTAIADKTAIVQEISQLEGQLANANAEISKADARLALTRRSRTSGIFTVLAGIIGIVLIGHWWWLWAVVGAAGALALVGSFINHRNAQKEHDQQQARVTQAQARLADLRVQ